jgi:hypothetical protein
MSICILTLIMATILIIAQYVTKDLREARVNRLIATLDRANSPHLFLALKFASALMQRLFVFIPLAHSRRKHRWRSPLICQVFGSLNHMDFPSLQRFVP